MPDKLPVAVVPPRDRIGWREWAALIISIGFALGIWQVDTTAGQAQHVARDAQQASTANRQIGYRNRAAICDFVKQFGGVEPKTCTDPELRPYRDARITPGQGERRNTTVLLCRILATLKQSAPQCAGDK